MLRESEKETPQQGQRKQLELEKGKTFVLPFPIDGVIAKVKGMTWQFYAFAFRKLRRVSGFVLASFKQIFIAMLFTSSKL